MPRRNFSLGALAETARAEGRSVVAGRVLALVSGRAYDLEDLDGRAPLSAQQLGERYLQLGDRLCTGLWGLYAIVMVDARDQRVRLFQDQFGGRRPVWYAFVGDRLLVDQQLERVLKAGGPWRMDDGAAEQFLMKGMVEDGRSLVEGVGRLPAGALVELDPASGRVALRPNRYDERHRVKVDGARAYLDAFERSLDIARRGEGCLGVTLSCGFDSNLILFGLRELTGAPLDAFTVGGCVGTDERPVAREIAGLYPDLHFEEGVVDGSTLERFPEIVRRLEGTMYERGIFLHYVLSQMVARRGTKRLILGDGADQVLNVLYDCRICNTIGRVLGRAMGLPPRETLNNIILRKNVMMMTAVGVETEYPYLNEVYLRTTRALYLQNGLIKTHHKRQAFEVLPKGVAQRLQKLGGATQLKPLFEGEVDFQRFRAAALSLRWHRPERPAPNRYDEPSESEMDYCLSLMYLYLFERVFLSGRPAEQPVGTLEDYLKELPQDPARAPQMKLKPKNPVLVGLKQLFRRRMRSQERAGA